MRLHTVAKHGHCERSEAIPHLAQRVLLRDCFVVPVLQALLAMTYSRLLQEFSCSPVFARSCISEWI